ncbi:hypothetical protein XPN_4397, partial [Xanthomonas arboricola pv. pruni MAFF 301427]
RPRLRCHRSLASARPRPPSRPVARHRRRWPRPAARLRRPARRWSTTAMVACCTACSRPVPTGYWIPRPGAITTRSRPATACAWCA